MESDPLFISLLEHGFSLLAHGFLRPEGPRWRGSAWFLRFRRRREIAGLARLVELTQAVP
jgi:hypothetical protein